MKQHKWHKELIAFANGIEVQTRFRGGIWTTINGSKLTPNFNDDSYEFRIRPETDYHYQWVIYDKKNDNFLLSRYVESVTELKEYNNRQRYEFYERFEKSKKEVIK